MLRGNAEDIFNFLTKNLLIKIFQCLSNSIILLNNKRHLFYANFKHKTFLRSHYCELLCLFYRYSVMLDCWKNNPGERPSFEKLVKVMRTLTLMNKHQVCSLLSCGYSISSRYIALFLAKYSPYVDYIA